MHSGINSYSTEKKQALSHFFFVSTVAVLSFIIIGLANEHFNSYYFLFKLLLGGLSLFSLMHYAFIVKYPNTLVSLRKFLLICVDVTVLTLGIMIVGEQGLFFLPIYILLVMESGVNFGLGYFYFTLFVSSISWGVLLQYSTYWQGHSDTVAIFAITTFLIPLVYLKKMMSLHEKQEELHETLLNTDHAANFDVLTGLPNRKHYESFMKALLKEKEVFALLFIDLNKFKAINDTHGHDVGDEVLIEVSKRLRQSIDDDDMLARLGGDEFVVISKRKKVFLPKFLEKLEEITIGQHKVGEASVLIELSIGVSIYPDDSKSETFLRKYADEAMYVAKKEPNAYHVFYSDIDTSDDSF